MDFTLDAHEERVLGVLIEKELSTPEYYPLSLNALVNACNQKSNRDPVVELDETVVVRALIGLKGKKLAWQSDMARVPKYGQNLLNTMKLTKREGAVLAELLLRGPQTAGELKARTERMYHFDDSDEVDRVLQGLTDTGFVVRLPRQPGRKECRNAHLFCGEPDLTAETAASRPEPATRLVRAEEERFARLEAEVVELRETLAALREEFSAFRSQFE